MLSSVHVVADSFAMLSDLHDALAPHFPVSSALLKNQKSRSDRPDAMVIAVDLRSADNIAALKAMASRIERARKRIFLIDRNVRLLVVQAYALGATSVIPKAGNRKALIRQLSDPVAGIGSGPETNDAQRAASNGAAAMAAMFAAVERGGSVDAKAAVVAAGQIADSVATDGLSNWLKTVRLHHEGTYQHCLLVTGVAVDFGLHLGMSSTDILRLYSAAMFHDIGKAKIPFAILDKPGRLDPPERALIETHPAAGYDILSGTSGISLEILDAVRHHHEYLDGSGYPDGLQAAGISDITRILTISDIFAALIEDRRYKLPMPRDQAYDVISGMSGKLEVPLVKAFKPVALTR